MSSILSKVSRVIYRRPAVPLSSSRTVPITRFLSQRPILPPTPSPRPEPKGEDELILREHGKKYTKYAAGTLFFLLVFWGSNKMKYYVPESEFVKDFDIPHTEEDIPRLSKLPKYKT